METVFVAADVKCQQNDVKGVLLTQANGMKSILRTAHLLNAQLQQGRLD